jgi:hypothetical protein
MSAAWTDPPLSSTAESGTTQDILYIRFCFFSSSIMSVCQSSDNAIRRWLKQYHRNGAGSPSISQMLTESRKRFLEAHNNQLDKLLCS